jgi:hypothetical protein
MDKALEGEHLCLEHQGNHSHYDPTNCTVCKLEAENATASKEASHFRNKFYAEEATNAELEAERDKLRAISDDSTLSWQQKHIESWTILHPRSEAGDE